MKINNNLYLLENNHLREDLPTNYLRVTKNLDVFYVNNNVSSNELIKDTYKVYVEFIKRTSEGDVFKFTGRCHHTHARIQGHDDETVFSQRESAEIINKIKETFRIIENREHSIWPSCRTL